MSMSVSAQQNGSADESNNLSFGVEAGLTISNYTSTDRYWREGFYVGARGKYEFADAYLTASLRLIRKGADAYTGDSDSDDFLEAYYLELPIMVGDSWRVGRKVSLFAEFGPYMAVGIGGKAKGEAYSDPSEVQHWDYSFFSKGNDSPRRFDCGLGLRAGVSISKVEISLSYEHGLVSVWNPDYNYSADSNYNHSFLIGLAYMF